MRLSSQVSRHSTLRSLARLRTLTNQLNPAEVAWVNPQQFKTKRLMCVDAGDNAGQNGAVQDSLQYESFEQHLGNLRLHRFLLF